MLDGRVTALLFPGQGSQFVGMAKDLTESYPVARQTFEEADAVLGFRLSELCFEGPEEVLNDTANTQPALYVAGIAALRALYEAWEQPFSPAFTAGHSLGEFTALTAAGALSFPDGLLLVRRRGELMRDADQHSPGGMAALLGLDIAQVESLCAEARRETGGMVVVANDNCPGQVVIAGDEVALAAGIERATLAGARRAVRLAVSIAAHSPLMEHASSAFNEALASTTFHPPEIRVIGNTTAKALGTVDEIRAELSAQLTSPVKWTAGVETMVEAGISNFIELGSRDVLTGLVRRIARDSASYVVDTPEGLAALL